MERIKLGTLYLENSPFPPGSEFLINGAGNPGYLYPG